MSYALRALVVLALPTLLVAQQQKPPAPRAITAAEAKAGEILSAVSQARGLPDGRVLVNDAIGRRVLLFEKDLKTFSVVADTTPATGNAYSGRFAGLIPYRGDSTLFVDPQANLSVYDPTVGEACLKFGHIFRRARGMYVSLEHKGRIEQGNWAA